MPRWAELLLWAAVILLIALAYSQLHNPFWSVGSDGDFFFAVARNVVQGQGLWHNGNPVGTTPPGWPLLLAAGMKLTPEIGILKLINSSALLIFFAAGWWVLRRFFGALVTAIATLLIAFSPAVTMMSWSFLSDPSFAALAALAVYAALRARESWETAAASAGGGVVGMVAGIFWPVACIVLVTLSVTVRWPGILLIPVIGAVLLDGDAWWRPRLDRRWIALAVAALTTFAMFFLLRHMVPPPEGFVIDERFPPTMVGKYELVNTERITGVGDVIKCLRNGGRYLSEPLWSPLARAKWAARPLGRVGWVLVVAGLLATVLAARRRRWLLLGAIAYCVPIVLTWPSPVARYLLPVLPILIAGVLAGLPIGVRFIAERVIGAGDWVAGLGSAQQPEEVHARRRWIAHGFGAAVVSGVVLITLLSQATAYYGDYYIMRSDDLFEETIDAGVHRRLPSVATVLAERDVQPGEVAISERKAIRRWKIRTHGWMRALYALLDRPVRAVPFELSLPLEESPATLDWLRSEGVRYYAWLPPSKVTLSHYRTGRLETLLVDDQFPFPISERQLREGDWWLYEISDEHEQGYKRMKLPATRPPTQVPHLN
jgi:hypothetical protein